MLTVLIVAVSFFAVDTFAGYVQESTTGVLGYDLVAYHTEGKPVRGDGNNLVVIDDVTYLFANEVNKKTFEANPNKYLPAFGGYCAFGASVGKKFVGDPEVWKIVDGILYLNLDRNIQKMWFEDISGNIVKAEQNWPQIKDKAPSDL
jgi:hypothetical protein